MNKNITFIIYTDFASLDLTGPLEVFSAASQIYEQKTGFPAYEFSFAATEKGLIKTSSGLMLMAETLPTDCCPHTFIVPGGTIAEKSTTNLNLIKAVSAIAKKAQRVVSVCTGAFLLAECGLLDGKRATTHWLSSTQLAKRYPKITVEPDSIYIRDGKIATSAGVTAGIDLALDLVEEDLGPEIAMEVARLLVLYRRRTGNQSQFSAPLKMQSTAGSRFADLHSWVEGHLSEDLSVGKLAEQMKMSQRNFARVFHAETGINPGKYVEKMRLDKAREMLESGQKYLQTVALSSGFSSEEHMRRTFQRQLGITPGQYINHFSNQKL
ncbi:GlxA family transcriptional regulator [Desulfovibrio sp. UCD-KL4C]|uniref:GlxA family transcriptional regulator n=1 Tax=Desulfovibrio sp. UCD-KL4C TaxID=2578120 RepID=UPI0025C0AB2C|nr:GlxA family transcriptional regulator [Desulfovibrio sp. UCD-KL4C]